MHIFLEVLCLPMPWMHTEWCDKGSNRAFAHISSPLATSVDIRAKKGGRFLIKIPALEIFLVYGRLTNLSNTCQGRF